MSGFIKQQTLTHNLREDDILATSNVLAALGRGDIAGAQRQLIAYHDHLLSQSEPTLTDYNPLTHRVVP